MGPSKKSLRLHPPQLRFRMDSGDQSASFRKDKRHILSLPIELQARIFSECISRPFGNLHESQAPLTVISVCRGWRDLAYATSSLWSSFEVCFGTWALNFKDPEGDSVLLSRMKLWLRRSGNHPLSVKLTYEPPMSMRRDRELSRSPSAALSLLIRHSSRWRDIELSIPSTCLAPLIEATSIHFPSLNNLVLNPIHYPPPFRKEILDIRSLATNCGQLTSCHINLEAGHALTLDDCMVILSQNISLTSCTLHVQCIFVGSSVTYTDKLVLPALSEFHLFLHRDRSAPGSSPETALTSFFGGLALYQLKDLKVEWYLNTSRAAWSACHPTFVGFLEHLSPTLESMYLGYIPMSEEQLMDCLGAVPFLTSVKLLFNLSEDQEPAITDNLLRALTFSQVDNANTRSDSSRTLLHLLQSINLQCHGTGCSERQLVQFIDSRSDKDLGFVSFRLKTQRPLSRPDSMAREVSQWRKKGIQVDLDCARTVYY